MAGFSFEADKALGKKLAEMDKQELCLFVSDLCRAVIAEVGYRGRRGGIYPDNICVSPTGEIALGPVGKSPWQGQELDYIAPELYWNGQLSAASDVYSVGLLMYSAVSGGRLPLEGECSDPQTRRMAGGNPAAPKKAGRRLGAIIEKCLRFKPAERYQTLEELRVVTESCLKDLYLGGAPSAEAIFRKEEDELDDVERMMVNIIEKNEDAAIETADDLPAGEPEDGVKVYRPVPKSEQKDVISTAQADMLQKKMKDTPNPAVPKLEEDGVLRPVTISQNAARTSPAVQYKLKSDRERKIAEEVKKRRRRPLAVILVLCAVLVMVAIIMNAMLKDYERERRTPDPLLQTTMAVETDPYSATPEPTPTPEPIRLEDFNTSTPGPSVTMDIGILPEVEVPVAEHSYQVVKENISWTKAAAACSRLGGHLAVINSEAEFEEITRLADEQDLTYVWIGAHRVGGVEKWENGGDLSDGFVKWARGEPTYIDRNDQVSEDYIMLWKNNGTWAYNDNRDDPYADYPDMFGGIIGYICEFNDT